MPAVAHPNLQIDLLLQEPSSPDMRFASRMIAQIQRDLNQRNRKMLRVTSRWLDLLDYVKMMEEEHLTTDALQSHTQFYRGTVGVALGLGTLLMGVLQNDDAEQLSALGVTYADLSACVEELNDLHRSLTSDLTPGMIAEMNERLFSSAEPA
jgi:hypothetical protein